MSLTNRTNWDNVDFTFICWGGGQLAIANAAFFAACDELGIRPSKIYASSGGTFAVSQRYIQGHKFEALKKVGIEFDLLGMTQLSSLLGNQHTLTSTEHFQEHLAQYIPKELTFEQYHKQHSEKLAFIASRKRYRRYKPVILNSGNIISALTTSCAFPGLLPLQNYYRSTLPQSESLISEQEYDQLTSDQRLNYSSKPIQLRDGDLCNAVDLMKLIYPKGKPKPEVVFSIYRDTQHRRNFFSAAMNKFASRLMPTHRQYTRKVNFNFPYTTKLTPLTNNDALLSDLYDDCYKNFRTRLTRVLNDYDPDSKGTIVN